jgi:hypothetical protein
MTLNGHHPEPRQPDEITGSRNALPAVPPSATFTNCERCGQRCRIMPGHLHNRCVICIGILQQQAKADERTPWLWWTGLALIGLLITTAVIAISKILGSMP